ncbi:polysaccharide biosynthesis/export family protein [Burkholderia sp. MSHR3999]|nr:MULTISPECIES: polysaccharide biosynthesis/export family protein [Burkholderia]KIP17338.1 polysaccharide biosynthesis/export family protein [Burkholderia sp. MSHR3999]
MVDLTPEVVRRLRAAKSAETFSEGLGAARQCDDSLGAGDTVAVSIWEAPPATLFGGGDAEMSSLPASSHMVTLPDQVIDAAGDIGVPFAGKIHAVGLTLTRLESAVVKRLTGKANRPQVMVRLIRNAAADVTVIGDVNSNTRMPLTPKCERLLDALAASGGVRQAVDKVSLQVTRGTSVYSMPLDAVIRDPNQNVPLRAGDVVTALYQPSSFMAFGATGKNEEIGFEGKGISLAQALARAGGLLDSRADAKGVFVFRLEDRRVAGEPGTVGTQAGSVQRVPTVYRLDLKEPSGMFLAQQFEMRDKDALYVSNAPVADIQKLANLFYTIVFPAVSVGTQFK